MTDLDDKNIDLFVYPIVAPKLSMVITFSGGVSIHEEAPHIRLDEGVEVGGAARQFCDFVENYLGFGKATMEAKIEAARAEERERCARIAQHYSDERGLTKDERIANKGLGAKEVAALIRAGSPAPAAPVVWTDEQVDAALRRFMNFGPERPYSFKLHQEMRAALEASSREVKP